MKLLTIFATTLVLTVALASPASASYPADCGCAYGYNQQSYNGYNSTRYENQPFDFSYYDNYGYNSSVGYGAFRNQSNYASGYNSANYNAPYYNTNSYNNYNSYNDYAYRPYQSSTSVWGDVAYGVASALFQSNSNSYANYDDSYDYDSYDNSYDSGYYDSSYDDYGSGDYYDGY